MPILNKLTLLLVIVGALNWGLVGLFGLDLVSAIFGAGSILPRLVFVIVGVSGAYQVTNLLRSEPAHAH